MKHCAHVLSEETVLKSTKKNKFLARYMWPVLAETHQDASGLAISFWVAICLMCFRLVSNEMNHALEVLFSTTRRHMQSDESWGRFSVLFTLTTSKHSPPGVKKEKRKCSSPGKSKDTNCFKVQEGGVQSREDFTPGLGGWMALQTMKLPPFLLG